MPWLSNPPTPQISLHEKPTPVQPHSEAWRFLQDKLEKKLKEHAVSHGEKGWNFISMSGKPAGGKFILEESKEEWINLCRIALQLGHLSLFTSFVQIIPDVHFFTLDIDISRSGYDNFFVRLDESNCLDPRCVLSFILEQLQQVLVDNEAPPNCLDATVLSSHGRVNDQFVKTSWRIFFYRLLLPRETNQALTQFLKAKCIQKFGNLACNFDTCIDTDFGRARTGTRAPYSHKVSREFCRTCRLLKRKAARGIPKNSKTCMVVFGNKCGLKTSLRSFIPHMWLRSKLKKEGWIEKKPIHWDWFIARCSIVDFEQNQARNLILPVMIRRSPPRRDDEGISRPNKKRKTVAASSNRLPLECLYNKKALQRWNLFDNTTDLCTRVEWILVPILGTSLSILPNKLQKEKVVNRKGKAFPVLKGLTTSGTASCPMNGGAIHSTSRLTFNIYPNGKIIVRCFMQRCKQQHAFAQVQETQVLEWLRTFFSKE